MLERQGKYEEAEAMHRQALRGYEKVLGPEHPDTLTSVNNVGLVGDKIASNRTTFKLKDLPCLEGKRTNTSITLAGRAPDPLWLHPCDDDRRLAVAVA